MKRMLSLLCIFALLTALFAGCGAKTEASVSSASEASVSEVSEAPTSEVPAEPESAPEPEAPSAAEEAPRQELTPEQEQLLALIPEGEALTFQEYPLSNSGDVLSVYYEMHPLLGQFIESPSELPIVQATEEITGVHIDYNVVSFMASETQLQLMIASGDLNDIMPLAKGYTPGADAAVEEELILDLTDWIPQYSPNYQGLIDYNKNFKNAVTTADGRIVGYSIYSMDNTRIYISGPEVRKDWLDKVGLNAPVTIDDYHEMLLAFKNQLGVETPMWLHYSGINRDNQLTRAFNINGTALLEIDGHVTSSLLQPGFKEYLEMMRQWHSEGLFAGDFFSDTSAEEPELAVVANDTYGLFYQYASEFPELGSYASDPDFEILAITDAVKNEGDKLKISNGLSSEATAAGQANVTTACENIELACKWLDFNYSPDGWLLCNYGLKDVSFTYGDDGSPHWTDVINNSEYPGFVAKSMYTMLQGTYLMDAAREFDAYTDQMIKASDIWASVEAEDGFINFPSYAVFQ